MHRCAQCIIVGLYFGSEPGSQAPGLHFSEPGSWCFLLWIQAGASNDRVYPMVSKPLWPLGDAVVVAVGAGRGPHGSQS